MRQNMVKKTKKMKTTKLLKIGRSQIDQLDRQIILALVQRKKVVKKITQIKKNQGLSRRDKVREDQLLANYQKWSKSQLSDEKLKQIRRLILKVSRSTNS